MGSGNRDGRDGPGHDDPAILDEIKGAMKEHGVG
jgi:hypothetical protein